MKRGNLAFVGLLCTISCGTAMQRPGPSEVQTGPVPAAVLERAIRRDIPMTSAIRRAHEAGTRDSTGTPGRNYWSLRTDYTIRVRLDTATQRLTGSETIVVHNTSPDTLTQIGMRLDMNHFRAGAHRAAPWRPAEITDGMVITRMTVNGAPVNLAEPAPTFVRPGDPSPTDVRVRGISSTNAQIVLPPGSAIPPGSRATMEIDWNHKVPGGPGGGGHRMTQRWGDTLFQPTQWYPRIAMYDDLRGWDSELYLGPSEFYNNFGRFDVRIDVPAGWLVSGTGVLQNATRVLTPTARERLARVLDADDEIMIVSPDEVGPGRSTAAGDRLVWHFVADSVNDFAWATARKFVWRATRATIPGRGAVPIHMLYLPERAALFEGAGAITRHALQFYSELWFPYPFPQLTLQDGPSAGMEYPMVINSNAGAADHEVGHQWWPMVVGTNETWYGWMDEGLDQYMNVLSDSSARARGILPARERRRALFDGMGRDYGQVSGREAEPPMMWNANYAGPVFYGFTTYSKGPMMLSMLGGVVGDSAVQRATREWARAWTFRHPSPWDYMFFMNRALGRDLGWFWYYWLFTTESVDGSIRDVATSGGSTRVTVHQAGQMPSPVVLRVTFAADGPPVRPMPNARMESDTSAIAMWPVDVWFGGSRTFVTELDFGGRAIQSVELDPFGRFPDRDVTDNTWPRTPRSGTGR